MTQSNASYRPRGVLKWLDGSRSADLLLALASATLPITHEALDALPASHAVYHVRDLLVTAGILPRATSTSRVSISGSSASWPASRPAIGA